MREKGQFRGLDHYVCGPDSIGVKTDRRFKRQQLQRFERLLGIPIGTSDLGDYVALAEEVVRQQTIRRSIDNNRHLQKLGSSL